MSKRDKSLTALLDKQAKQVSDIKEDTNELKEKAVELKEELKVAAGNVTGSPIQTGSKVLNATADLHSLVDNSFENTDFGKLLSNIDKGINDKNSNLLKLMASLKGKFSSSVINNTTNSNSVSDNTTNSNDKFTTNNQQFERPIRRESPSRFFSGIDAFQKKLGVKDYSMLSKRISNALAFTKYDLSEKQQPEFEQVMPEKKARKSAVKAVESSVQFTPLAKLAADTKSHKAYVDKVLKENPKLLKKGNAEEVKGKLLAESKELRKQAKEYVEFEKDLKVLKENNLTQDSKLIKTIETKMEKIKKYVEKTNRLEIKEAPVKPESAVASTMVKPESAVASTSLAEAEHKDSNTKSQEEIDNSEFQENLLNQNKQQLDISSKQYKTSDKQLKIQTKIYEILQRFESKGFGGNGGDNKNDDSIFDDLLGGDKKKKPPTRTPTRNTRKNPKGNILKRGAANVGRVLGGMAAGAATAGKAVLESGKAAAGAIGAAAKGLPTKAVELAEAAKGSVSKVAGAAQTGVAKVVKSEVVKDTGKLISESIAKRLPKAALKAAGKSIPGIGALIGLGAAAVALAEGDKVAAGLEAVSGLGSAATAIPATAALVAKEVYEDVYGIKPEDDPEAGARLTEVKTQVWEEMKKLTGTEEPKAEETAKEDAGKLLEGIKPEDKPTAEETPKVEETPKENAGKLNPDVETTPALEIEDISDFTGEPIIKGQPLTKKQMSIVDTSVNKGIPLSFDVKEAYDLSKGNEGESTASVNGQPVKAEPLSKDYNLPSHTEMTMVAGVPVIKGQPLTKEQMLVSDIKMQMGNKLDPIVKEAYDLSKASQLKPTVEKSDSSRELIKASTESEDAKMTATGGGDSGTTIISPTTITNSNQTNVVRKDVKNNDGSLNRLFDSRYKFNS